MNISQNFFAGLFLKTKKPESFPSGFLNKVGAALLSRGFSRSTIAADGLNFCVRDGNRCTPAAVDTNNLKTLFCLSKKLCHQFKSFPAFIKRRNLENLRPISTGQLNTLLCAHAPPINLLISKGSLKPRRAWENLS